MEAFPRWQAKAAFVKRSDAALVFCWKEAMYTRLKIYNKSLIPEGFV